MLKLVSARVISAIVLGQSLFSHKPLLAVKLLFLTLALGRLSILTQASIAQISLLIFDEGFCIFFVVLAECVFECFCCHSKLLQIILEILWTLPSIMLGCDTTTHIYWITCIVISLIQLDFLITHIGTKHHGFCFLHYCAFRMMLESFIYNWVETYYLLVSWLDPSRDTLWMLKLWSGKFWTL